MRACAGPMARAIADAGSFGTRHTKVRAVRAAARTRAARAHETGTPEGPSVAELLDPARIALHFSHRFRRRRLSGAVAQLELPPADVAPSTQLVTDVAVHADRPETERLVQPNAGGVRQRHACVGRVEALQPQQPEQLAVEGLADAAPPMLLVHVHTDVDGPLVGGALPVLRRISVPAHDPA